MHHGMDVIRLIEAGSSEPVLRRFALDCAQRVVDSQPRSPLRPHLAAQRGHLSAGHPDAAEVRALLEAVWERDDLDEASTVGFALDNGSPAVEVARETANEAAQDAGMRARPGDGPALPVFFLSDNEQLWQARRLAWLRTLPPEALWQGDDHAPLNARLDFDPEATLGATLETTGPHAARVLALLDGDVWSVLLDAQGLCVPARAEGPLTEGQPCVVRVRDATLYARPG